jgi:hypothetical protein
MEKYCVVCIEFQRNVGLMRVCRQDDALGDIDENPYANAALTGSENIQDYGNAKSTFVLIPLGELVCYT